MPVWEAWNEKNYVEEFEKNAGLYSIITRIGSTAATSPYKVYRIKDEQKYRKWIHKYKAWTGARATEKSIQNAILLKELIFTEDNDHSLNELIDKPNSHQGGNQFTQNCIGFKLLSGNRFLFKNILDMGANAGRPKEVYNLPPCYTAVVRGTGLWDKAGYQLSMGGPIINIPLELILHSAFWNPRIDSYGSHLRGMSPLRPASRNLTRTDAAEDRSVAMLQNAGAAGVVFAKTGWTMPDGQPMSVDQASALKRKWNEEILGSQNAGAIGLANQDLGYIPFGMTAVELSILEQEKYSQDQLCNIYKVPPGLFQSSANATDNNISAWNKQLITQACFPALSDLRDDWNEIAKLYKEDIYVDFDSSVFPELQEDQEKTSRIMSAAWWIKPNEKRLAMNMDEDPESPMMNEYLVPSGMQLLSDLDPANLDRQMREVDENNLNENI